VIYNGLFSTTEAWNAADNNKTSDLHMPAS
jgi:hypothetical protein